MDYLQVIGRRSCRTEHCRCGRFPSLPIHSITGHDDDRDERDREQTQEFFAIFQPKDLRLKGGISRLGFRDWHCLQAGVLYATHLYGVQGASITSVDHGPARESVRS